MKSRPREHARKEGFKSISSDASSICHKTSSKLFLVVDILHLVRFLKIYFNHVLPLPTESSVNWSNKHVFVRRNCKKLWGNLRRWYLVNGHGDLFFLFYISKHCTIDNLWKSYVKFYFFGMTLKRASIAVEYKQKNNFRISAGTQVFIIKMSSFISTCYA